MSTRIKYPLTTDAKEYAEILVNLWDKNEIDQFFGLVETTAGADETVRLYFTVGVHKKLDAPPMGVLRELSEYRLISIVTVPDPDPESKRGPSYKITLLQELRNAVQHDFLVSDFFLTTSAVGTIVYGNLEMRDRAILQSAAVGIGEIHQNLDQFIHDLTNTLGSEVLAREPELNLAIIDLASVNEQNRLQKMGKVVQELGRCLDHIGNAGAAITALSILANFLR